MQDLLHVPGREQDKAHVRLAVAKHVPSPSLNIGCDFCCTYRVPPHVCLCLPAYIRCHENSCHDDPLYGGNGEGSEHYGHGCPCILQSILHCALL